MKTPTGKFEVISVEQAKEMVFDVMLGHEFEPYCVRMSSDTTCVFLNGMEKNRVAHNRPYVLFGTSLFIPPILPDIDQIREFIENSTELWRHVRVYETDLGCSEEQIDGEENS